jgi:hypothetical protein
VRIFSLEGVSCFRFLLSLRLPSVRIEAAAGFPVGRGRFVGSGLTVAPSGRDRASRGLLSLPLLSPMERGASTLEERGFPFYLLNFPDRSLEASL